MTSISCKAHLKEYCARCSFGSVHYIGDDTKHWTERWFWIVLIALCWYGSAVLTISAFENFRSNPISFGVETTYIDWETKMPAVAVCEGKNKQMIWAVSDRIWTEVHAPDLEDVLTELAYFNYELFVSIEKCYKKKIDPNCPDINLGQYAELVRSPCPKLLANCSYNMQSFDCCEYFQPISTDLGTCFLLNSVQTANPNPYPMILNRTQQHGKITMEILVPSVVYTLSEDEVPNVVTSHTTALTTSIGHRHKRYVVVRNIENDQLVRETTPEQRACRFNDENENGLYPHYSYGACTTRCRKLAELQFCGCNNHLMPGTNVTEHCNMTGLVCLAENIKSLKSIKPKWATRAGLACNCLPSCDEAEITVIRDEQHSEKALKKKKSIVEITMAYLPTERFKRNVVRSRLDLVVSIGGTTGLFVGASLLSFVELLFYFTVRYVTNICMQQSQQKTRQALNSRFTVDAIDSVKRRAYLNTLKVRAIAIKK